MMQSDLQDDLASLSFFGTLHLNEKECYSRNYRLADQYDGYFPDSIQYQSLEYEQHFYFAVFLKKFIFDMSTASLF